VVTRLFATRQISLDTVDKVGIVANGDAESPTLTLRLIGLRRPQSLK